MGLYQGNNIGPYVESTYLKLLQFRYLPAIMNGLMIKLEDAPNASEEKLEILRVMRMLDDKSGRDNLFVEDYMRKYWSEIFSGQKALQVNLLQHLNYALNHTDWYGGRLKDNEELIKAYKPYELSIQTAQRELSQLSIYDRVYQNLKIRANSVLPSPLDYRDEIGAGFDSVFVANNQEYLFIPRFFTESGLKNYFVKQKDQLVEFTAIDSWVLNLKDNLEYSDADKEKISERISEQYLNDYISAWRSVINNLDIKNFNSIDEAILALEKITGGSKLLSEHYKYLLKIQLHQAYPLRREKNLIVYLKV
ncbi:ImcF-related family protein [Pasteurella bettyae]|uniref:ImcF-related family protein n=1 Tax=Pasteurella bettyae TaxID=752 RepID=UPI003D2C4D1E